MLVTVAGVANATFALPMKFARQWAWENIWLAWTLCALVLLPIATAFASIPSLGAVYRDAGTHAIAIVTLCGAGWGLGQVLFGLSIDAIGIGLTFSIVLGISAAVGSLIPLLRLQHVVEGRFVASPILPGLVLVLAGVGLCAAAGRMREKAQSGTEYRKSFAVGVAMALCSGACAAAMNFGVAFGEPILRSAWHHGASAQQVVNAVWLPLLMAGAVPNIAYCVYLLTRRRSWASYRVQQTPAYVGLAIIMAILWFFSTALYGIATTQLGELGVVVGWPVFISLIVVTAGILGMLTGEWEHSGTRPVALQMVGMLLLVLAVVTLSRAQKHADAISALQSKHPSTFEISIHQQEAAQ
jgi:L-rhamnose-H+ transport protein